MNSVDELVKAPISLSSNAIAEVKKLVKDQNLDDSYGLRIGVEGGGCSGMSYALGFDTLQENDQVYMIEDVKVYMKKAHLMYLMGTEVDHQDGLNARGFVFKNPNASSTCGCGTSFGV